MIEYVNKQTVLNILATHDGNHLYRAIQNLTPSNVQEPRYGEWLKEIKYNMVRYKCSFCGYAPVFSSLEQQRGNFCPNCGADMREEGD